MRPATAPLAQRWWQRTSREDAGYAVGRLHCIGLPRFCAWRHSWRLYRITLGVAGSVRYRRRARPDSRAAFTSSCVTTRRSRWRARAPAITRTDALVLRRTILVSRTVRWVCIGTAAQLIAVSALWSWLPSFLNRAYGIAPETAGVQAALVVLAGALGAVILGAVVDWAGSRWSGGRFIAVAILCILSMIALVTALAPRRLASNSFKRANIA